MRSLALLCIANCDPWLANAEGDTVIDLAETKHPEIQDQIRRHGEWMLKKKDQDEIMECDEFARPARNEHMSMESRTKGCYLRDRFFMAELAAVTSSRAKFSGWGARGKAAGAAAAAAAADNEKD